MSKKKAKVGKDAKHLEQIPNVGPSTAEDFRLLGIEKPSDLIGKDALTLYEELNCKTGTRQDPCVLDVFLAAIDFMNGGESKPWWKYTAQRKELIKNK